MAYLSFHYGEQARRALGTSEQMIYLWNDMRHYADPAGDVTMMRPLPDGMIETLMLDASKARHHQLFPKFTF